MNRNKERPWVSFVSEHGFTMRALVETHAAFRPVLSGLLPPGTLPSQGPR